MTNSLHDAPALRQSSLPWSVLRIVLGLCHDAQDERQAIHKVCEYVRTRVAAARVTVYPIRDDLSQHEVRPVTVGRGPQIPPALMHELVSSVDVSTIEARCGQDEVAVPIALGNAGCGALVCRWHAHHRPDEDEAVTVLLAAATALAPTLVALLDRSLASPPCSAGSSRILGVSAAAADVRAALERAGRTPFPVIIEGESGTGKELAARALHLYSPRRAKPFRAINCAALSDELFESEIFGHARGAFTSAVSPRIGLLEEAHGGTLFLDEVADLSLRAQAKVLRVLEDGAVRRVGENVSRTVDVRFVAASNRPLQAVVSQGTFRADLWFRLNVIHIVLPPLRDRREDIPLLARSFWEDAASKVGSRATLHRDTVEALVRQDWPGNVRELQNAMRALAARAPRHGRVRLPDLPGTPHPTPSLLEAKRAFEKQLIESALARGGGSVVRAAQELGLTRHGVRKAMVRLSIELPAARRGGDDSADG